ncbi:hypothetical protein Tco_1213041 [Tanacetum coccineum]
MNNLLSEEESIDSGFARFNIIITSLKALDEGFSNKNYVRKFLRALHLKWRAKVMAIKESKDLSSLALDDLIKLYLEIDKLKESQAKLVNDMSKFVKFKQRTNSLKEMLNAQSSPSSKGVDGSLDKEDRSSNQGFVYPSTSQNGTESIFKPPTSS